METSPTNPDMDNTTEIVAMMAQKIINQSGSCINVSCACCPVNHTEKPGVSCMTVALESSKKFLRMVTLKYLI